MAEKPRNFRHQLSVMLADLDAQEDAAAGSTDTVELDQQAVGRLSRMDALQNQAMALAAQRRRAAERVRILAALRRIDEGEFGFCTDCGEEITPERLGANPTVAKCLPCARG